MEDQEPEDRQQLIEQCLDQKDRTVVYMPDRARDTQSYAYLDSLRLVQVPNTDVNFYGIVANWDQPRKTRGADSMMSLTLVDVAGSIELRVFAKELQKMPLPRKAGDIIRLHRARVVRWAHVKDGERVESFQLVASMTRTNCAWVLFSADSGFSPEKEYAPYQQSHQTFNFTAQDMRCIDFYRNMSAISNGALWKAPVYSQDKENDKAYRRQIQSVVTSESKDNFWDLVAMVVAVQNDEYHAQCGQTIVWVWDGTNAPPYRPFYDSRRHDQLMKKNPEDLTAEEFERIDLFNSMHRLSLDMSTVKSLPPPFGTIMPIRFRKSPGLTEPVEGSWIKIRNCAFIIVDAQVQGFFTGSTKWARWAGDHNFLIKAAIDSATGPAEGCKDIQYGPIYSSVLHQLRPISTIRDILWLAKHPPNYASPSARKCEYFRCKARVMCMWPSNKDLSNICIHKSKIPPGVLSDTDMDEDDEWVFACRATLEDPTGFLDANLFGRDAAYFFSDVVSAQDFNDPSNVENLEKLRHALRKTLGWEKEHKHTGVWLDVCLLMHWSGDGNEASFRIFDTLLKVD